jgi:Ca2+/Na+ antiporter
LRGAEISTALIAMLELSEVSGGNHHAVLLVPSAVGLVCLASWSPDAGCRRVIGGGLAVAAALIGLSLIQIFRQLSALFFASITLLVVMIFLICQVRARVEQKETTA